MTSADPEGQPRANRSKAELRIRLRAARAARRPDPSGDDARTARALAACAGARVVAAYASTTDEPPTVGLIEALHASGVRVLLPVLRREPDWAWYSGPDGLAPGPFGIPAPTGPALGAAALGLAEWIWLPGLAGSPDGRRLGTGGGWYDRALGRASADARLGLLLYDDEVLDLVPTEPWDRDVQVLVTERRRLDVPTE
nr:5-formyltetrahydrofolate cyclo-ligase [Propionicimonas sp.]